MSRAQSALEYLVTYGWAILVIVIIAGVLWYFGVFNPGQFAGEKQCGGFSSFICQDFRINTTGDLIIVLNNKVGGTILTLTASGGTCSPTSLSANANATCVISAFVPDSSAGDLVDRTDVTITFTDGRSGITHSDTGFVRSKIE